MIGNEPNMLCPYDVNLEKHKQLFVLVQFDGNEANKNSYNQSCLHFSYDDT